LKTALIVGAGGQDGHWLGHSLRADGVCAIALDRKQVRRDGRRTSPSVNILDRDEVDRLVAETEPDEIYHLAAIHGSSEQESPAFSDVYEAAWAVHCRALVNLCEAALRHKPAARVFYAASSRVFGRASDHPQTESTPRRPECAYGLTKSQGIDLCRYYRDRRGLFCSAGILYNHESPLRPETFVSRKIARAAALAEVGRLDSLPLGAPDAVVDWGAAPDYVEAMRLLMAQETPTDAIIASGTGRTVRDFARAAFTHVGLRAEAFVVAAPDRLRRPVDTTPMVGCPARVESYGWHRRYDFDKLVAWLVDSERDLIRKKR
jgi:GDPmannose 4,6-dehydratase